MPKRVLQGKVVSSNMDKTVKVLVQRRVKHPVYGKYVTNTKSYLAHDDQNNCKVGDEVQICECKPISKRKTWEVLNNKG